MRHSPPQPPAPSGFPPMRAGLFVWSFGAVLYLLGFFHRVAPAVITGELMQDFGIGAAALGNLSALYFYSYVAMQIPTGILADRLGPRLLLSAGAIVATLGTLLFALSPGLAWAGAGRLLIGGSVAVAFVCLLKVAANWFAPARFAMISGLALCCGVIGAVCAGTPLRLLVNLLGWREVMLLSAAVSLATAVCTWIFVRNRPREKGYRDFLPPAAGAGSGSTAGRSVLRGVAEVFRYRNTPLLFLIPGGLVGCILTFSGLWGVPYLTAVYSISQAEAAFITSSLMVSWAVGGPFFGWLSDRMRNRKGLYLAGCAVALGCWSVVIFIDGLNVVLLTAVLLVGGFASGTMIISFAYAKESVPIDLAGTVSGVINMGVMMGPMILQPAVGLVLDRLWQGGREAGVPVYHAAAYRSGFSLMLAWLALSLVLLLFTRETGCRQLEE